MVVGNGVAGVEEGASGVKEASGYEEDERMQRHGVVKRLNGQDTGPAHDDVQNYGYGFEAAREEGFEDDTDGGATPDDAE